MDVNGSEPSVDGTSIPYTEALVNCYTSANDGNSNSTIESTEVNGVVEKLGNGRRVYLRQNTVITLLIKVSFLSSQNAADTITYPAGSINFIVKKL